MSYFYFGATIVGLIVAIALWATGSDFSLVLFLLACVVVAGGGAYLNKRILNRKMAQERQLGNP